MNLFRRLFFVASTSLILCSCNDIGEGVFGDWWPYNRNEASTTSKGSTFQIMQEKGNFSLFLSALEKTEYSGVVNGAGLVTVFAPTDEAFSAYLNEKYGTNDLDAIPLDELELVVAYHLIKFSYSPEDFLGFSTSAASENPVPGDGSAYRYKTYARKPIEVVTDPITREEYMIYHKEEWLPVISSRLFSSKNSPNPEQDYEKLFPNGTWAGNGDHLYVSDANVTEVGIPSDNGYLYVINKVSEPMPTIYEELASNRSGSASTRLEENYSLFALIVQTLNLYVKDDNLTNLYAEPGDEITMRWTMAKPGDAYSLPAIASEWAYNDELGSDLMKSMTYTVTAAIPTDEALSEWMNEYYAEWFTAGESIEELINRLPYIHLYQIAASHLSDKRDIIIPSQLSAYGVSGTYGENYQVPAGNVVEELFCSNGVIYGIDKVLVSPLFDDSFVAPIFKTPYDNSQYTYNWYLTLFMQRQNYGSAVGSDEYTLFIRNDATLSSENFGISGNSVRGTKFVSDLTWNGGNGMGADPQNVAVNNSLVPGILPPLDGTVPTMIGSDTAYLRYYLTRQDVSPLTYVVNLNGQYYSINTDFGRNADEPQYNALNVERKYSSRNGVTYEMNGAFLPSSETSTEDAFTWLGRRWRADLASNVFITHVLLNNHSGWNGIGSNAYWGQSEFWPDGRPYRKDYNNFSIAAFLFSDEAVENGLASGYIPRYTPNDGAQTQQQKDAAKWALRQYLNYYLIDKSSLGYPTFPLPGLHPDGTPTNDKYSLRMETLVDYVNPIDAKYLTVEWDPADPMVMTIEAENGQRIQTTRRTFENTGQRILPHVLNNGAIYVIDEVFNHRTMFGN